MGEFLKNDNVKGALIGWAGTLILAIGGSYVGQLKAASEITFRVSLNERRIDVLERQTIDYHAVSEKLAVIQTDIEWIKRQMNESPRP